MDLLVKYNLRAVPVVDETASIKGVIRLQEAFTAVFPEAEGE